VHSIVLLGGGERRQQLLQDFDRKAIFGLRAVQGQNANLAFGADE
jgi:hypothetical protein